MSDRFGLRSTLEETQHDSFYRKPASNR
jgi:hypothetical protein